MIDLEEIRKEIASKHDTLLGRNDPILMLATMMERVLEQSVATLNAQHDKNLKSLLEAMKQGDIQAKAAAGRLISESGNTVSKQIKATLDDSLDQATKKLDAYVRAMDWRKKHADTSMKLAIVAAGISGGCLIGTMLFIVQHFPTA